MHDVMLLDPDHSPTAMWEYISNPSNAEDRYHAPQAKDLNLGVTRGFSRVISYEVLVEPNTTIQQIISGVKELR